MGPLGRVRPVPPPPLPAAPLPPPLRCPPLPSAPHFKRRGRLRAAPGTGGGRPRRDVAPGRGRWQRSLGTRGEPPAGGAGEGCRAGPPPPRPALHLEGRAGTEERNSENEKCR